MVTQGNFEKFARAAYAAYGQVTDFKNYQGKPMPAWEDLGEKIQAAWGAAAKEVFLMAQDTEPVEMFKTGVRGMDTKFDKPTKV